MKFKLGCLKDKKDNRDFLMRAYLPLIKLPSKIDYTKNMSPVRNQGDEGTCVGFATTVGMKEYQEKIDYGKLVELSPRFLYNECKKIDGMPDTEGTSIRIAVKVLKNIGVCREKYWKYRPHQKDKPQKGAREDAKKFKIKTYARILDLNELRHTLATKGPCVIGVYVFNSMMETKDGKIKINIEYIDEIGEKRFLEKEIIFTRKRHQQVIEVFRSMGTYAPIFGLLGTLLGVVQVLKNITDVKSLGTSMALAVTTTLYGIFFANFIFLPLAGKLESRSEEELLIKEVMIEGILSIQKGDIPLIVSKKLEAFFSQKHRKK
jgi:hypothetical protein